MNKIILLLVTLCTGFATLTFADEADKLKLPGTEILVNTHDGNDVSLYQYPAQGKDLVIWVGANGWHDRAIQSAMDLADKGIEVWQIDFAEALMLTSSSNFMRNLDARYVADVIDAAHRRTGKRVMLFAQGYVAIPVLRGATLWQQREKHDGKLVGAVLFSPDLVTGLPELGKDPEYLPIVRNTAIPLMIYQGSLHGSPEHFARLVKELSSNNPNVYHQGLPGVTSIFYHDENSPVTLKMLQELPQKTSELFKFFDSLPEQAAPTNYIQPSQVSEARLDIKLKPYAGNPEPLQIDLRDAHGKRFNLNDYHGKVTVVNFWATWCPPCVEEIPSLNRLREHMKGQSFELISVNYADSPRKILDFMQKVSVEFPVLVDTNGKTAQRWNVIGFPSTFVIGKDGKIKYGVNAAIHWDSPEVVEMLKALSQ
jgi:thiol-disulfide isomerase/thioredoxin